MKCTKLNLFIDKQVKNKKKTQTTTGFFLNTNTYFYMSCNSKCRVQHIAESWYCLLHQTPGFQLNGSWQMFSRSTRLGMQSEMSLSCMPGSEWVHLWKVQCALIFPASIAGKQKHTCAHGMFWEQPSYPKCLPLLGKFILLFATHFVCTCTGKSLWQQLLPFF